MGRRATYLQRMTSFERVSLIDAAARLGISVPDTAILLETGRIAGFGSWVFTESLSAYIAARSNR